MIKELLTFPLPVCGLRALVPLWPVCPLAVWVPLAECVIVMAMPAHRRDNGGQRKAGHVATVQPRPDRCGPVCLPGTVVGQWPRGQSGGQHPKSKEQRRRMIMYSN